MARNLRCQVTNQINTYQIYALVRIYAQDTGDHKRFLFFNVSLKRTIIEKL
jgi:hypothetical protein